MRTNREIEQLEAKIEKIKRCCCSYENYSITHGEVQIGLRALTPTEGNQRKMPVEKLPRAIYRPDDRSIEMPGGLGLCFNHCPWCGREL